MDDTERMDSSATTSRCYYCHECKKTILPLADLTCPDCNGGFVEEMQTEGHEEHSRRQAENTDDEYGNIAVTTVPGVRPSRHSMPRVVVMGRGGPGRPFQVHFQQGRLPIEAILSQLFSPSGLFPTLHGDPRDYVWGQGGLDAIITHLLNSVDITGPPPADQGRIDALPTVKISSSQTEKGIQCPVCFDDFGEDEEVKVLPCKHHYHEKCILPWLEIHGTCPVCRKDLNGSDTSTQEFNDINETLESISTAQENGPSTSSSEALSADERGMDLD